MTEQQTYMQRCLELAIMGLGKVAPNPMVGCVIVNNGKVIGEGYHKAFGEAHAEVNAINSVMNKALLASSQLYVSLEPCAHFGKTPPCADLIIKHNIKRVIIGCIDPNPLTRGKGIEKLIKNGCDITIGALEQECMELNKRFFTFIEKKRPYIIMKWAQSEDGFIDGKRTKDETPAKITGSEPDTLSHQWRSEEQAIMVGTNTVIMDNPLLTTRLIKGKSPIRVLIDRHLKVKDNANIFNNFASVIVFNEEKTETKGNVEFVKINFEYPVPETVMKELYSRNIQSIIIEGGRKLLQSFIDYGMWDEARVFTSGKKLNDGVKAPAFQYSVTNERKIGTETLREYRNHHFEQK